MSTAPALYTIRVDGHLGAIALSAFPALVAEQQVSQTVLTGFLDRSALYGVLAQLEILGIDLVEVHQVRAAGPPPRPAAGSPTTPPTGSPPTATPA
ncbi:MAG: hypothetical protein QOI35_902 [Cryptosporangiaceae bacterium]|nr:hypothetical protein [Cryptosporangiaceae bacterium]